MVSESVPKYEANNEQQALKIAVAKRAAKRDRHAHKRESTLAFCKAACDAAEAAAGKPVNGEMPPKITLTQVNGQWFAMSGKAAAMGDCAEIALDRLMIKMLVRSQGPQDAQRLAQLYLGQSRPSCEIRDFRIITAIASNNHYLVEFDSNVRMTRGDFESIFCAGAKRRDMDVEPAEDDAA